MTVARNKRPQIHHFHRGPRTGKGKLEATSGTVVGISSRLESLHLRVSTVQHLSYQQSSSSRNLMPEFAKKGLDPDVTSGRIVAAERRLYLGSTVLPGWPVRAESGGVESHASLLR